MFLISRAQMLAGLGRPPARGILPGKAGPVCHDTGHVGSNRLGCCPKSAVAVPFQAVAVGLSQEFELRAHGDRGALSILFQQDSMISHCTIVILALAGFLGPAASADTVHLKNSDRLTGRIEKLEQGKLYLETDYAGTIEIAWESVSAVASDETVQIEAGNGLLFTGKIAGNEEWIEVRTEKKGAVRLTGITAILPKPSAEEADGIRSKLSGSADAGLSLTRGNSWKSILGQPRGPIPRRCIPDRQRSGICV